MRYSVVLIPALLVSLMTTSCPTPEEKAVAEPAKADSPPAPPWLVPRGPVAAAPAPTELAPSVKKPLEEEPTLPPELADDASEEQPASPEPERTPDAAPRPRLASVARETWVYNEPHW